MTYSLKTFKMNNMKIILVTLIIEIIKILVTKEKNIKRIILMEKTYIMKILIMY